MMWIYRLTHLLILWDRGQQQAGWTSFWATRLLMLWSSDSHHRLLRKAGEEMINDCGENMKGLMVGWMGIYCTFTACLCDLSKWIVTQVTLSANHSRSALALAALGVTWPWEGAHWIAVTWQADITAPPSVMKLLTHTKTSILTHAFTTQTDENHKA